MDTSFDNGGVAIFATCPCCGYPAIRRRSFYEICSLCGWEDDGQDDPEFAPYPNSFLADDVAGGPNGSYSLTEARVNFAQYHQMYRPLDKPAFARMNEDRALRMALVAIYSELLPRVEEDGFVKAFPRIDAAFKSISGALSLRVREHENRLHKEREKRYRQAFDALADRFTTSWNMGAKYFEATMEADGRLVYITARKVFPHAQVHGDFNEFLAKTIASGWERSSFNGTDFERWLIISDDSVPPLLEAYRQAYGQLSHSLFKNVYLVLADGRVEELSR